MAKPKTTGALRYIGDGSALDNVPARDLGADEAERYDRAALLNSGLYVAATDAPATDSPPAEPAA